MVQKQVSPDFLDPAHEWRRLFSGTWGTFLLVLVAAGGGVVAAKSNGAVALGMIVVASGLMVMVIIYFMGTVSGAHSKPEVTLAFALRRNFPRHRVPGYVLAQMMGVWRQRCFYGICLAPSAPWARARRVAVRHWRWKSC
jgi:aquaporin Z